MADPACLLSNGGAVLTGRRIVEFPEKTTFEATDSIPGVAEVPGGLADVRFDGATLLAAAEAAGEAGAAGIAKGADGATLLPTSGAPSSALGKNGDYAFDTAASVIYGPKAAGVWPAGVSFKGGKGDTGDVTPAVTQARNEAVAAAGAATTKAGEASTSATTALTTIRTPLPITADTTLSWTDHKASELWCVAPGISIVAGSPLDFPLNGSVAIWAGSTTTVPVTSSYPILEKSGLAAIEIGGVGWLTACYGVPAINGGSPCWLLRGPTA